jgi:signal transduction histidine kinase/CheY-like chemotaxis protein
MSPRRHADRDRQTLHVLAAQVRLLYGNRNVGVAVTVVAAAILAQLEWSAVPHAPIVAWCVYMGFVSAARFALAWRYDQNPPADSEAARWGDAFAVGAGFAGIGWGVAAILLYPEADLSRQVYLLFILGGMMLGGTSLLAAWPAAFLVFLLPAGLGPAIRLALDGLIHGDEAHLAMGLLAALFTCAMVFTTGRLHRMIVSSLEVRFENQELVEELRIANTHAETLNEQLEARVQERTAELRLSAEQLRTEIAQRREVEEELLRARKLESLGVLAGGIAHDFNNFLTIIQGNAEMARMRLADADPVQPILESIGNACQRAAFLSSQLLTFAQGGVPVRKTLAIGQLVRDAVELSRAGSQTTFEVTIARDLRAAAVDPAQFVQALHSILLNARQAMPEGGIVEVNAGNAIVSEHPEVEARVRISIRDYGCGIPFDVLPRIFDPYFTTRPGSSGLGLATAYAVIAKHGGTLSVESRSGDGSVFTIDLPASPEAPAPASPTPAAKPIAAGAGRLLIMDDEEALRQLLETVLTGLGYHVQTARDGAEAIALCEDAESAGYGFDAALLDLTVSGGMGGLEASGRLREIAPHMKLIVSSGYSDAPVMADFRKHGFDDVIRKPWVIGEVSEVFRRLFVGESGQKVN